MTGDTTSERPSGERMDAEREMSVAYKYMCHLEEAKKWMERILNISLPCTEELEESLRDGVVLAKVALLVNPKMSNKRIYDVTQQRRKNFNLNFRHTENINIFLSAIREIGLPKIFIPEVTDIYDRKNMPKVIYCIHALSAHLFRLGKTPLIQDLYGKVHFSVDLLSSVSKDLKKSGNVMPSFQKIGGLFNDKYDNASISVENILCCINEAIDEHDAAKLLKNIKDPLLDLKNIIEENVTQYLETFIEVKKDKLDVSFNKSSDEFYEPDICDVNLTLPEIQGYILSVNVNEFFVDLRRALKENDEENIQQAFLVVKNEIQDFDESNLKFYSMEVKNLDMDTLDCEKYRDILKNIVRSGNETANQNRKVNNLLKSLENAIIDKNSDKIMDLLKNDIFCVEETLQNFATSLYVHELQEHLEMTGELSVQDVKSSISVLNAVAAVTTAIDLRSLEQTWFALLGPKCALKTGPQLNLFQDLNPCLKSLYHQALIDLRERKLSENRENAILTFADIQDCIDAVNQLDSRHVKLVEALECINCCIDAENANGLLEPLQIIFNKPISHTHLPKYLKILKELKYKKFPEKELWLQDVENAANKFETENDKKVNGFLDNYTGNEVTDIKCPEHVEQLKNSCSRFEIVPSTNVKNSNQINEETIINLQACIRGFIVRQIIEEMTWATIRIQRWWRGLKRTPNQEDSILNKYKYDIPQIILLQALWRGKLARRKMHKKMIQKKKKRRAPHPPNCARSMSDATNELIVKLRNEVIESVKRNQDLERQVSEIDTKIGLLIRNRITVESLLSDNRLNNRNVSLAQLRGIKELNKEAKVWLDGYQQLFYLLQTRPEYLTRLITSPFANGLPIQTSIMNLFNHGSTSRDAYLILKLFETALKKEIATKFVTHMDVITGNSFALKMAVAYARQTGGQNPLANILGPIIKEVLNEKTTLDTNPVEIYRRWINECESKSGQPSDVPRTVSQDVALKEQQVVDRLQNNIAILTGWVKLFLERLTTCSAQFPFALRFLSKTLRDGLTEKFPHTSEKDILKIISHLIYYQYVNSAIVAPDAFHIINLPADKPLKAEQRRNLASIAKILQFAATKTGFGEDSRHLMQLNPFIIDCHEKMKQLSRSCCSVQSLEAHYCVNKYSEVMLTTRPRVYMTVAEICECHSLITEKISTVAPDPEDILHAVLQDLGPVPTPATLLACSPEVASQMNVGKTLLCLELDNHLFLTDQDRLNAQVEFQKARVFLKEAQTKELHDLKCVQKRLDERAIYFSDQLKYYRKYLDSCLNNLTMPKKTRTSRRVQFSAAKLKEMGVLIDLDGVPPQQMKNLQFEISTTKINGVFHVKGRFMGVEVDSADIDIQNLLSMQFEGSSVMNLFGKAKININLLIFLLNKTFLKKTMNTSFRKVLK